MIRFHFNPALVVLSALLWLSTPYASAEGRYRLVTGKKNTLCQRFQEHLESATERNDPPNCHTEFAREFPEFVAVGWREVLPKDHPDLSAQAWRYLNDWPWDRPELRTLTVRDQLVDQVVGQHQHGWWRMWLAEADLDNDGIPEKLLRVEDGRCADRDRTGPRPFDWRVPIMVLNAAQTGIDTVRSEWILGVSTLPPSPPYFFRGRHGLGNEVFDLFRARSSTYFYRWEDDWPLVIGKRYDGRYAGVTVYRIQNGKTDTVCRFKVTKHKD